MNQKIIKRIAAGLIILLFGIFIYLNQKSNDSNSGISNGTTNEGQSEEKKLKITKEEYLKEKGITDLSDKYKENRAHYEAKIANAPSKYEILVFLGIGKDGKFKYQEFHQNGQFDKFKEKTKNLSDFRLFEFANSLDISKLSSIKKINLKKNYKKYDLVLATFQKQKNSKHYDFVEVEKAKDFYYHLEGLTLNQYKKLITGNNISDKKNNLINIVGLVEKKFTRDESISLIEKILGTNQCYLDGSNEVKKYVYTNGDVTSGIQKSCEQFIVGYYNTEQGKKIIKVYLDSYYGDADRKFFNDNYKTIIYETNDFDLIDRAYYNFSKEKPLIFF